MARLHVVIDRLVARVLWWGSWLALPIALVLFLQWPLRELIHGYSRQANDVGQWLFALYVALAATAATRARRHIATDALAQRYPARARRVIYAVGLLVAVVPWSIFVIAAGWETTLRSVVGLERFPDTFDPLYFLIKIAVLLLPALLLVQAVLDVFAGGTSTDGQ